MKNPRVEEIRLKKLKVLFLPYSKNLGVLKKAENNKKGITIMKIKDKCLKKDYFSLLESI